MGIDVPLGSYNPEQGVWVAADSGRVIKILGITNGTADIDTTGNGTADNGVALGMTTAERQQLASRSPAVCLDGPIEALGGEVMRRSSVDRQQIQVVRDGPIHPRTHVGNPFSVGRGAHVAKWATGSGKANCWATGRPMAPMPA